MSLKRKLAVLVATVTLAGQPVFAHHSHHSSDKIAGAIVGAALISAIDSNKHEHHRSYDGYRQPAYNPGPYSPERGILCYPMQEVCVTSNGNYHASWTRREFPR